ncbi:CheF family chemotaxis protein [Haloarculaceae archaeon H-GB1-1]|nr:CheF family chemotaxis protein [Haloarculaceae archaeon H-GB1-1]
MSESVIADFVAKFNSEATSQVDPVKGRILLSQKRLVLAASARDDKLTIPLSKIFDIAVGHVPPDLGDFFNSTVTIAFDHKDRRIVAAVEASDEKIQKFSTVLFKAILNGTEMTIKHPARMGGRITDNAFEGARLFLKPKAVQFKRKGKPFTIELASVTDFQRVSREIAGSERPVLTVRHQSGGQAITSLAATSSARKMNILGRYLRLEYSDIMEEIGDISLSDDEKQMLVAIYSTSQGMPLADILNKEASEVTMMLSDLRDDGLVEDAPEGPTLTPKGKIVASNFLEDVNT